MNGERKTPLVLAGVAAALLVTPAIAGVKDDTVTVTINRVAQVDNLDAGDAVTLGKDDADFYVQVWIDGKMFKSENMSRDDGNPGWTFTAPVSNRRASIVIKLFDDDGGLEEKDDHADINRKKGMKDLSLTFDTKNNRIHGDISGRAGQMLQSGGMGDDDKARIWFTIS